MKNSLINLDWLAISIKTKSVIEAVEAGNYINYGENVQLLATHRRTSNFKQIFDVLINGMLVAELQAIPNKTMLQPNHAILKFNNELLYMSNLLNVYNTLKNEIKFFFHKFNQIDIALDTPQSQADTKFMYLYAGGKIDFLGKQEVTVQFGNSTNIKYFRIGSRKSSKFIRCYYKRQELEVSNKKYISDYWKKNGINEDEEVFRTELCLKGSIMNKLEEINQETGEVKLSLMCESTLAKIQDSNYLLDLFKAESEKLTTYYKTKDRVKADKLERTNRVKHYNFIKINLKQSIYLFERLKDNCSKVVHKIKMTSKFMHQLFLETGENLYKHLSDEIVNFEDMATWKANRVGRWEQEYSARSNPKIKQYLSTIRENLRYKQINFTNKNLSF